MPDPTSPDDAPDLDAIRAMVDRHATRRLNWGWFGDPWPSGICYDDDGRLREEMRKDPPTGEDCALCGEPIEPGHAGQATPHLTATGPVVRHVHRECMLREVLGSPDHLDGRCACRDLARPARPERSYRDEALEVWARVAERGLHG